MLTQLLLFLAALRFAPTPEPVYAGPVVLFTSWPAQSSSGVYLEDEPLPRY
jgi:hypothetical protein